MSNAKKGNCHNSFLFVLLFITYLCLSVEQQEARRKGRRMWRNPYSCPFFAL